MIDCCSLLHPYALPYKRQRGAMYIGVTCCPAAAFSFHCCGLLSTHQSEPAPCFRALRHAPGPGNRSSFEMTGLVLGTCRMGMCRDEPVAYGLSRSDYMWLIYFSMVLSMTQAGRTLWIKSILPQYPLPLSSLNFLFKLCLPSWIGQT